MNLAFKVSQGKYILMISDDCLLTPGSIMHAYRYAEQQISIGEKLGGLAFYWRNWGVDKRFKVGLTLGNRLFINHGLYLRSALEEVGWADEESFHFYSADGDICLKLWDAGYQVLTSESSYVEHFPHANKAIRKTNSAYDQVDWENYIEKWAGRFSIDEMVKPWRYKEYVDSSNTASKFPRLKVLCLRCSHIWMSFKKKLLNIRKEYCPRYQRTL